MPIAQEVNAASIFNANTGKVLYQSGYSRWWKEDGSGVWWEYSTQPQGTLQSVNFLGLVASPQTDRIYSLSNGEENSVCKFGTTTVATYTYHPNDIIKWHCGT